MSTGHSQYSVQSNSWLTSSGNRIFNRFAGTPPTTSYGATFRTTTALAPITAPVPTFTPGNITAPSPIHTSFPITVGVTTLGSPPPSNLEISASEYRLARDPCSPGCVLTPYILCIPAPSVTLRPIEQYRPTKTRSRMYPPVFI